MGFVQIIEFRSSKGDEIRKLDDEWIETTSGKSTATRVMQCVDRNDPNRHFTIVEFPSYEAAMRNSEMPETGAMAEEMGALCDGPPTFYDLDVTDTHDLG